MIAVQFSYPLSKEEEKFFSPENYVRHMRLSKALLGDCIKKAFVYKGIPGRGYNAPGQEERPECVATGIVYFDSYEDYEERFLKNLKVLRKDVPAFSEIRAYANVYEVYEVSEDPLTETEQALLDSYIAAAEE